MRMKCNTLHLGDALRVNLGLKVGIILFYQGLKVDFLLGWNFVLILVPLRREREGGRRERETKKWN